MPGLKSSGISAKRGDADSCQVVKRLLTIYDIKANNRYRGMY
jgi:hypothetical protein